MSAEQTIKIIIYNERKCVSDWPPESASEFLSWFAEKLDTIPEEYRHTAKVELDTEVDYDTHSPTIQISYARPETDKEKDTREERERVRKKAAERMERAEFEKLKRKFEKQ